jgi:class 3 adenylate cyclase
MGADSAMARFLVAAGLRFPDARLEAEFSRAYRERFLFQFRLAALLGAATYSAFGFLDTLAVDDTLPSQAVRFGMVVPIMVAYLALTFWRPFRPFVEVAGATVGLIAGLGTVLIMVVSDLPTDYGHAGIMVVMVFVLAFARFRFLYAIAASALTLVAYEVAAFAGTDMTGRTIAYNNFFLISTFLVAGAASYMLERLVRIDFLHVRELAAERERSDRLLLNVLPRQIAQLLRVDPSSVAHSFPEASVLFADIVGFTPRAERFSAHDIVEMLDDVFTAFDELALRHGLEKIKTVGDAYMAVAGVPELRADHARAAAEMALDMQDAVSRMRWPDGEPLAVRIGISSGPVVAGVIGRSKFAYDLWGDTVNTASRMESHGAPGIIQVSEETYALLRSDYECQPRGTVEVKGKGRMTTFVLVRRLVGVPSAPEAGKAVAATPPA